MSTLKYGFKVGDVVPLTRDYSGFFLPHLGLVKGARVRVLDIHEHDTGAFIHSTVDISTSLDGNLENSLIANTPITLNLGNHCLFGEPQVDEITL